MSGDSKNTHIRLVIVEEHLAESSSTYKHLDFECELSVAKAISSKFGSIMSFINSANLNEFKPEVHKTGKWSRKLYRSNRKNSQF